MMPSSAWHVAMLTGAGNRFATVMMSPPEGRPIARLCRAADADADAAFVVAAVLSAMASVATLKPDITARTRADRPLRREVVELTCAMVSPWPPARTR